MRARQLAVMLIALIMASAAMTAEIRVAVAANFRAVLANLSPLFEDTTGHTLVLSAGSTGLLYAQIRRGAPFDVFLAADAERPKALADAGLTLGPPVTYATGRLVMIYRDGAEATEEAPLAGVKTLAMATPRTAPYGVAATEVLDALGADPAIRIANTQSVAGVNAAVVSGAADAGLAAWSSMPRPEAPSWLVPQDLHKLIRQDAVALAGARNPEAAQAFLAWLQTEVAQAVISTSGYDVD